MKNFRKLLVLILSFAIFATISFTAFAADGAVPILEPEKIFNEAFLEFTGVVEEIQESEGKTTVIVKGEEDALAVFILTPSTYYITENPIEKGAVVTGVYDSAKPMIMIYPPQFDIEAIAVDFPENTFVKVDRFNGNMVSYDEELKLNISDNTEIVLENGEKYEGAIADRKLVVFYTVSTRSIPAQTTPEKIIVLYEDIMALPEEIPGLITPPVAEVDELPIPTEPTKYEFVVEDDMVFSANIYANADGVVMVPLRVIAEACKHEIGWDQETKSVLINNSVSLSIGNDYYIFARMAPIELGAAPELTDETTYVPLSFFRDVMKMNNAYILEGQVVVNNSEKME